MKRWWYMPERAHARSRRRGHAGRVLARAAVAGVLSLPIPSHALDVIVIPRTSGIVLPRTGGAVIEAWAFGTLTEAKQPNSQECDLSHVCELAISSSGGAGTATGVTVETSFESAAQGTLPTNLAFALTETIDYERPLKRVSISNGQGACYATTGVMAIGDASSTLVLDIVGQVCQLGISNTQLVFTGSYVTDSASTGTFTDADGVGSMTINTPSGLQGSGTTMKASLVGQLKYGN